MKIYLSGAIPNPLTPEARQRFEDAEKIWNDCGLEVINPLKNGLPDTAPRAQHRACNRNMLATCDALYLIDGWKEDEDCETDLYDAADRGFDIYWGNDAPDFIPQPFYFARQPDAIKKNKLDRIKRAVFETTGLQLHQYNTKKRAIELVFARMLFVYQCRRNNMKLCEIKKYLKMTHSAMLYLLRKYNDEIKFNNQFRELAMKVNNILNPKQ
jgi:hypothetical protein